MVLLSPSIGDLVLDEKYGSIISKKNRQRRMIFWDCATYELLADYIDQRRGRARSPYVFISLNKATIGKKITTRSIQRLIETYRTNKGTTPHSFRHALGMRAVKSGVHSRYIQKILARLNPASATLALGCSPAQCASARAKRSRARESGLRDCSRLPFARARAACGCSNRPIPLRTR